MAKKKSYLTLSDQFCGAGGSSQGAQQLANEMGGGLEVSLAMNHWKLAIETHSANFPNAIHDCTDISACDPRRYPSTDILLTSPECTNHTLAQGKKVVKAQLDLYDKRILDPAAERSRATMWDVPRFAEYHKYNLIVVENVVDARKWVMFDAWLMAMHALGYNHKCVYLNSMHCHPTPQSRDRMYVVFWKKGNPAPNLDITPAAYCQKCAKEVLSVQTWKNPSKRFGKYKQQYIYSCPCCAKPVDPYYYAAFNCIDWSDIGTRIGDRPLKKYYKKGKLLKFHGEALNPLSPNTLTRAEFGLKKYGKDPFVITTRYTSGLDCRVKHIGESIGTQPGDVSHGMLMPFVIKEEHSQNLENAKGVFENFHTQTTRQSFALLTTPWIIEMNRTGECKPADRETGTFTGGGINHAMFSAPFIVNNHHSSKADDILRAIGTQCCNDKYGILTNESFNSFINHVYGNSYIAKMNQPIGSMRTKHGHELISFTEPKLEDCFYRMLRSHEVGKAMAFADDYIVKGNERDKVKQYGNAVTPPAMKTLLERCVKTLN